MTQNVPAALDTALIRRIRSEYLEMPGLHLTTTQAQRLFGLSREECERLLDALVTHKFLAQRPDGAYGRSAERVRG